MRMLASIALLVTLCFAARGNEEIDIEFFFYEFRSDKEKKSGTDEEIRAFLASRQCRDTVVHKYNLGGVVNSGKTFLFNDTIELFFPSHFNFSSSENSLITPFPKYYELAIGLSIKGEVMYDNKSGITTLEFKIRGCFMEGWERYHVLRKEHIEERDSFILLPVVSTLIVDNSVEVYADRPALIRLYDKWEGYPRSRYILIEAKKSQNTP